LIQRGKKGKVLSAGSWEWVGVCVHPSRQSAACKTNMPWDFLPRNRKMYSLTRVFVKIAKPSETMPQLGLFSG
jgi:hypothetical protein